MIAGILFGIVTGLLANELCEFSPWCARKLVRWSAFRRYADPGRAEVRAEELTAVINDRPGNLFKLITAVCFVADAVIFSGRRAVTRGPADGPGSTPALPALSHAETLAGVYGYLDRELKPLGPHDPRQVGRYGLVGVIDEGGMGRVYLGTSAGGIRAAIKVMHSRLARDASFRERFRREADLAKRVSGRFTARILDSGVDDEIPWLATEYISGPTLEQAVAQYGEFPEEKVLVLASQLAQALRDIHSGQIIHRDLKPSNIICSPAGIRVIDFGIARALGGRTVTKHLVGTIGYMPPEHLRNRPVSAAGDIFSLGCVLVYAATGMHPKRNAGTDHSADIDLRNVPYRLRELIGSCVQVNPDRRSTVEMLLKQIEDLRLPGNPGRSPSPTAPASSPVITKQTPTLPAGPNGINP